LAIKEINISNKMHKIFIKGTITQILSVLKMHKMKFNNIKQTSSGKSFELYNNDSKNEKTRRE